MAGGEYSEDAGTDRRATLCWIPSPRMPDPSTPAQPIHSVPWPRCGASAAVFRRRTVLLIERGKGALKGRWSLPGGHVEPGETAAAAALREVAEETSITAEMAGFVDLHELILRDPKGRLSAHYMIAVFAARWRAGEPVAGEDATAARFVPLDEVASYPLTEGAAALIDKAWAYLAKGALQA